MKQKIDLNYLNIIDPELIPDKVYNRELTEEQKNRLATGRQTALIKDIIVKEGEKPIDAKLSARLDEEGRVVIDYDYAEKTFRMPEAILGMTLSKEQKDKLYFGELLSVNYKGDNLYVGVDPDLNKVTVKSAQQLGIPDEISNYKLTEVDKYYLAAGKSTSTHLFSTKEGDYFTANFSMTKDSKGIEFENIKFVDKSNAKELELKYNVDEKIIDEAFMLPPVRITEFASDNVVRINENVDLVPELVKKKIVTSPIENSLNKSTLDIEVIDAQNLSEKVVKNARRPIVEYKNVVNNEKGYSVEATEYYAPYTLKGVKLTDEQRKSITDGKETYIEGLNFKGEKKNAYVTITPDGSGLTWKFEKEKFNAHSTEKGFTVKSENYFVPNTLKGVTLSDEQKESLAKGKKTLVQQMDIRGEKKDAYVQFKKDGNGMEFDFKSTDMKNAPEKKITPEKDNRKDKEKDYDISR